MSDTPTKSENKNENRGKQRYKHLHHLDITFQDKQWPAEVIDWSIEGIQVFVNAPLSNKAEYKAEFDIHRMSFIPDEEYENDDYIPPVEEWCLGGKVQWVKKGDNGVAIGIKFEESLEGLPLSELPDFITDSDLCHLRIFLSNKGPN